MTRFLWKIMGLMALALGAVGVVLPLLPTTPFVLLAAFAFGKGSPRLRARLVSSRLFGDAIRDWETRGAIHPRHKTMACAVMAAVLLASIIAGLGPTLILIQALCMAAAATYVLTRPSG